MDWVIIIHPIVAQNYTGKGFIKVRSLGMQKVLRVFFYWADTLSTQELFCGREAVFLDPMSPLAVISYLSACKSQRTGTC